MAKERPAGGDRILACVRSAPGLTVTALSARVGIPRATVAYHLERLERAGHVRSVRTGRSRVVFPTGDGPHDAALAALASVGRRRVACVVCEDPGVRMAEVARRLGLTRATVHHHVRALKDAGLLAVEAGSWGLRPTASLRVVAPRLAEA